MRSMEERYKFLVSRLKVEDVDYWEGDAMLTMESFCFGFSTDNSAALADMDKVIDLAIDSAEWDAQYKTDRVGE